MRLLGNFALLEEIEPKHFSYVIAWRNDKKLNKYLNQPFVLTLESQQNWYENIYLKDHNQKFMIMIDKETNLPFGTIGLTDLDRENKVCIMGRLLLGNTDYAQHPAFWEAVFIFSDYTYTLADIDYIHVVKENRNALRLNKILGFIPNESEIKYPDELFVNGMEQIELYRTKEMYLKMREKLFNVLMS